MSDQNEGAPPAPDETQTPTEVQTPSIPMERFNEVYARQKEMERIAAEAQAQNAALSAQLAEVSARMLQLGAPKEQPLTAPETLDPAADAYLQRKLDAQLAAFERRMEGITSQLYGQVAQMRYQAETAHLPPELVREAEANTARWKKEGRTGWDLPDALAVSLGARVMEAAKRGDAHARALLGMSGGGGKSSGDGGAALDQLARRGMPSAPPPAGLPPRPATNNQNLEAQFEDADLSDPEVAAKALQFYGSRIR